MTTIRKGSIVSACEQSGIPVVSYTFSHLLRLLLETCQGCSARYIRRPPLRSLPGAPPPREQGPEVPAGPAACDRQDHMEQRGRRGPESRKGSRGGGRGTAGGSTRGQDEGRLKPHGEGEDTRRASGTDCLLDSFRIYKGCEDTC